MLKVNNDKSSKKEGKPSAAAIIITASLSRSYIVDSCLQRRQRLMGHSMGANCMKQKSGRLSLAAMASSDGLRIVIGSSHTNLVVICSDFFVRVFLQHLQIHRLMNRCKVCIDCCSADVHILIVVAAGHNYTLKEEVFKRQAFDEAAHCYCNNWAPRDDEL